MNTPHVPGESTSHLSGERRRVTVMFADITAFTSLAESMDPEQVRVFINGCFERLAPIVAKYGTTPKPQEIAGVLVLPGLARAR